MNSNDPAEYEGGEQQSRENRIMDDLTTMNDTCQKPGCMADSTDTYRDEHGNGLDLCERHYYELVSGGNIASTSTNILGDRFIPQQDIPRQTADSPTPFTDKLNETIGDGVGTRRSRGTRDLHPSVDHDDDDE